MQPIIERHITSPATIEEAIWLVQEKDAVIVVLQDENAELKANELYLKHELEKLKRLIFE